MMHLPSHCHGRGRCGHQHTLILLPKLSLLSKAPHAFLYRKRLAFKRLNFCILMTFYGASGLKLKSNESGNTIMFT